MASHSQIDDDDYFGGDFPGTNPQRRSGQKRSFGDFEYDEEDILGSKKVNVKAEETAPGGATAIILDLRQSLESYKDKLATSQSDLEAAKLEIQKWHSAFQNESFVHMGSALEPKAVVTYLQNLKSSEESLREQLEKAKKKESPFIGTVAKREQEIAELKSKPEAAEWKTKTINKYEDLEELFAKDRANGEGAETTKEKKRRWAKTKADSVCGDNAETVDDIDYRISRNEYNLEGIYMDLEDEDVEILPKTTPSQVPYQSVSTSSNGKRKKTETMEEVMKTSFDKISNAIERSTNAILESSASIAKFRSRVISSEEIAQELEEMGVQGGFFDDAFEFLTDNPEKAKKFFGYPKKGRLAYLAKLVYQV